MKKTCINCKYKDIDYCNEYPCCECNNKSRWEQWQDSNYNYQPTVEDLIILELEKIKAEMEIIHNIYKINIQGYSMSVAQECIDIIDKHISKLKGENK